MEGIEQFKANQKAAWATFALLENLTGTAAPYLVRMAGIRSGQKVLDVACGTGVVALTAARTGASVHGIDLTPELVARAKENGALMQLDASFQEGDAESLPFPDAIALMGRYAPPPPAGIPSPAQWGDPGVIRDRLGSSVSDLTFARRTMVFPTLSPQHYRTQMAENFGPAKKLFDQLEVNDPEKAASLRREIDALAALYFEDNRVRQDFLITRATKA